MTTKKTNYSPDQYTIVQQVELNIVYLHFLTIKKIKVMIPFSQYYQKKFVLLSTFFLPPWQHLLEFEQ